ncbi:hypothetical protein PEV8663_04784 [Pelagimonas varians]|uniref:Uncharacterized protein n=1 Tax=Pelagimonas varians TaxID=696760 RepID=A0A238L6K9_9RHOB|nr:hypothetical protein PEV8663_04784 [Pelagimonas varians]
MGAALVDQNLIQLVAIVGDKGIQITVTIQIRQPDRCALTQPTGQSGWGEPTGPIAQQQFVLIQDVGDHDIGKTIAIHVTNISPDAEAAKLVHNRGQVCCNKTALPPPLGTALINKQLVDALIGGRDGIKIPITIDITQPDIARGS